MAAAFAAQLESILEITKNTETKMTTLKQCKDVADLLHRSMLGKANKIVNQTNDAMSSTSTKISLLQTKLEASDVTKGLETVVKENNDKVNGMQADICSIKTEIANMNLRIKKFEDWYTQHCLTMSALTVTNQAFPITAFSTIPLAATVSSTTDTVSASKPEPKVISMVLHAEKPVEKKLLPDYNVTSEQSFKDWSQRFKDVITAAGTNEDEKQLALLKLKLTGWARQRFDELTANEKDTLDHALTALTLKFDTKESQHIAMAKLKAFQHMSQGQSIIAYAETLEKLVLKALAGSTEEIRNARLLEEFMDRLPFNVAFYVKDKSPATFQVALEHARKYEALWLSPSLPSASDVSAAVVSEIEQLKEKVDQLQFEEWQDSQQSYEHGNTYCQYCDEYGHFSEECQRWRSNSIQMNQHQSESMKNSIEELKKEMAQLKKLLLNDRKPGINSLSWSEDPIDYPKLKIIPKETANGVLVEPMSKVINKDFHKEPLKKVSKAETKMKEKTKSVTFQLPASYINTGPLP